MYTSKQPNVLWYDIVVCFVQSDCGMGLCQDAGGSVWEVLGCIFVIHAILKMSNIVEEANLVSFGKLLVSFEFSFGGPTSNT